MRTIIFDASLELFNIQTTLKRKSKLNSLCSEKLLKIKRLSTNLINKISKG